MQQQMSFLDSSFGKTSPAHTVQTKVKTSEQSLKKSSKLKTVQPLFLDLCGGGGKSSCWNGAGYILGRGYSVAWRTLDAQFWGVPQRRRRIYLVADFRGERADKILFERNGLSRSFKAVSQTWKGTADTSESCAHNSGQCFDARGNGNGTVAPTLTGDHENRITDYTAVVCCYDFPRRDGAREYGEISPTILGMAGTR